MLGIKEIKEIIPHRHPFLLVDCIEELEPGVRAVGYKAVTYNEPYFFRPFPGGARDAGRSDRGGPGPDREPWPSSAWRKIREKRRISAASTG